MQAAPTDMTVSITGESGSGKESFSKIIHSLSLRKHGKFIAINCGAIPEGTIDSELFGHEKGAFTGAVEGRKGYFAVADGGTLFLDEVAELPLTTQVRLLRVLETGEFMKVGSSKVEKTNVRIVAASHKNIIQEVEKGKFREDLYYRLNTVPIYLPALRERAEDIALLFRKFAADFSQKYRMPIVQLDADAVVFLQEQHFPGNIRQLRNLVEQITVLETDRQISQEILEKYLPTHLPIVVLPYAEHEPKQGLDMLHIQKKIQDLQKEVQDIKQFLLHLGQGISQKVSMPLAIAQEEENLSLGYEDKEQNQKEQVLNVLKKYKGKRKEASEALGISERTLYRKIKEFGLEDWLK
jgi:DNA-binding NtrC family response regulator